MLRRRRDVVHRQAPALIRGVMALLGRAFFLAWFLTSAALVEITFRLSR